ncbi:MAG TPA: hypothetical protein VD997_01670 [Phycisphaerales bacterium]|nr:hypothetical protein [Phycisphaerales bacterium]
MHAKVLSALALTLLALPGCSGNRWSESFQPDRLHADALAAPGLIRPDVRVVPPERMLEAIDAETKFLADHSRTRANISPRQQRDLQRLQFPILGLLNDPDTTMLLGTAEVTSDKPLEPTDPAIAAAAQDAGASVAVVTVFPPDTPGGITTAPTAAPTEGTRLKPRWRGLAWYYAPAR